MNRVFFLAAFVASSGAALLAGPVDAANRELETVESAANVLEDLAGIPLKGIPPALMADAQGVIIIPDMVKAGFVIGGKFGRGILLVRQANGQWSNPVFVTMSGGSVGWQIGVQATDIVLVFKTKNGLERMLQGKNKVTLGGDLSVAAGPVGRDAQAATDAQLKAEIYSYSRSRGLFAGASVEGAALLTDAAANEAFYGVRGGQPRDVWAAQVLQVPPAIVKLNTQLARISGAPPVPVLPAAPPVLSQPEPVVVPAPVLPPPTPIQPVPVQPVPR